MKSAAKVVHCNFCNKKCRSIDLNVGSSRSLQCDYHGAVVVYYLLNSNEELISYIFKMSLNDKKYWMQFVPNGVVKFKIDITESGKTKNVISLEYMPNIKPEDAQKKLLTYITFS